MNKECGNAVQKKTPLWVLGCALISALFLPVGIAMTLSGYARKNTFSIQRDSISIASKIGLSTDNSWIYISIALVFTGIFTFLTVYYFRRHVYNRIPHASNIEKKLLNAGFFFMFSLAIGQMLTGLFPLDINDFNFPGTSISMYYLRIFHYVGGYCSCFGFALGFSMLFYPLWKNRIIERKIIIAYAFFLVFNFLVLILFSILNIVYAPSYFLLLGFFNDNVLEWGSFVLIDAFIIQLMYHLFKTENQLSFSVRDWFVVDSVIEIVLGIIFIFGYIWLVSWQYNIPIKVIGLVPIIVIIVISKYHHGETFHQLGFSFSGLLKSVKSHFIFTILFLIVFYLLWSRFFPVDWEFYRNEEFWNSIILFSAVSFMQVYVLLAFFYMRYKNIFSIPVIAIILSAFTFTIIFFPNQPMMIFSFIVSVFLCLFFSKWQNIYPAIFFFTVLLLAYSYFFLGYSDVGPDSDWGRWSDSKPVSARILNVQGQEPAGGDLYFSKACKIVKIKRDIDLRISGRVEVNDKRAEILSVSLIFNGKEYPVKEGKWNGSLFTHKIHFGDYLRQCYYKLYIKTTVKYVNERASFISPKVWVSVLGNEDLYYQAIKAIEAIRDKKTVVVTDDEYWFMRKEISGKFINLATIFNPLNPEIFMENLNKLKKDAGNNLIFVYDDSNKAFVSYLQKSGLIKDFILQRIQSEKHSHTVIAVLKK